MKIFVICFAAVVCFLVPAPGRAQNTGRIDCARSGGYVYLYSSLATMDVRATLQCGEVLQITSRSDDYFGVRTAKGVTGYVPVAGITQLKDQVGVGLPAPATDLPARERIHYDDPRREPAPAPRASVSGFALLKDTPARVKLLKTVSSANAHVGDRVEFVVLDDLLVEGVPVLHKGTKATGVIAEADAKKRFGHSGRLAFSITSINLLDGEKAPVRCYQEVLGSTDTTSGAVLPLASGKDVAFLQDSEFTVLIDGNVPLKRDAFESHP
jgi:hypothetical protein